MRDGVVYAAGPAGAVARRASDGSELVRYAIDEPHAIAAGDGVVVVRGRRLARSTRRQASTAGGSATATAARPERRRGSGPATPSAGGDARRPRGQRSDTDASGIAGGGALAIAGTRLYVAGDAFASFDLRDGTRVPWSPPLLGGTVRALAAADGVVAIGGDAERPRRRSRASTSPRSTCGPARSRRSRRASTAPISALHQVGGVLYAGGAGGLAALDPQTGARAAVPRGERPGPRARRDRRHAVRRRRARDARRRARPTDSAPCRSRPARCCRSPRARLRRRRARGLRRHAARRRLLRAAQLPGPRAVAGPAVDGRVLALREDGAGGLWAGGSFAGGNVAHFAADGTPLHRLARDRRPRPRARHRRRHRPPRRALHPDPGRAAPQRRAGRARRRLGRGLQPAPGGTVARARAASRRRSGRRRRLRLDLGRDHRRTRGLRRQALVKVGRRHDGRDEGRAARASRNTTTGCASRRSRAQRV